MSALHARSCCKGTVALNKFLREDAGVTFDVVNVLGVISEELAFVLE